MQHSFSIEIITNQVIVSHRCWPYSKLLSYVVLTSFRIVDVVGRVVVLDAGRLAGLVAGVARVAAVARCGAGLGTGRGARRGAGRGTGRGTGLGAGVATGVATGVAAGVAAGAAAGVAAGVAAAAAVWLHDKLLRSSGTAVGLAGRRTAGEPHVAG